MEEPGGLQFMGSLRVRHNWMNSLSLFTFIHWRRKWQPTQVFLPGESQGQGSLVAAPYGVAQSRTWLMRLSSSSSKAGGKDENDHFSSWVKQSILCIIILFFLNSPSPDINMAMHLSCVTVCTVYLFVPSASNASAFSCLKCNSFFKLAFMLFFFSYFLATLHSLQDLSSPTRDWTLALAVKVLGPKSWISREFPKVQLFF